MTADARTGAVAGRPCRRANSGSGASLLFSLLYSTLLIRAGTTAAGRDFTRRCRRTGTETVTSRRTSRRLCRSGRMHVVMPALCCKVTSPAIPAAAARSATSTTSATASSSSPPIASAPSTGCCRRGIPDKGRVLTALTLFWLEYAGVPNHLLSTDLRDMGPAFAERAPSWRAARCLVRKARGRADRVRGARLPGRLRLEGVPADGAGLRHRRCRRGCSRASSCPSRSSRRPPRKSSGHDENISFEEMVEIIGARPAAELRRPQPRRLPPGRRLCRGRAASSSPTRSSSGAGLPDGELILIDEVLTPDSSRFWPADGWTASATVRRRSTSNSCATGWRRPAGTRTARRRRCRRRWCGGRGRSTWRRTSD